MPDYEYWQAVQQRDSRYDGTFVFAVRSTGIYCRPSCPARRPRRENVRFFAHAAQAERAGFRACLRCRPNASGENDARLTIVQRICEYVAADMDHIPTLGELGSRFNLSPFYLQRLFKRIVGVSPRQYAEAQRRERLKQNLKRGETVTGALYDAGYQSSSTAYARSGERFGMTLKRYQKGGQGLRISYSITPCPLDWLLVAVTDKGICAVKLGDSASELETTLRGEFPAATLYHDESALEPLVKELQDYLGGERPHLDLPLDVQATAFQQRVWDALRKIPYGARRSYQDVANAMGRPKAVRAVAQACAHNPAALVIPCHRVVREDGNLGGYRWGIDRKRALLDHESREIKERL